MKQKEELKLLFLFHKIRDKTLEIEMKIFLCFMLT
jgi:hypothetical protein